MAFKFSRSKSSQPIAGDSNIGGSGGGGSINYSDERIAEEVVPKLTNAQLSKLTKVYPSWLRDSSALKQLPGVYQGVLGQVQLQPAGFATTNNRQQEFQKLVNRQRQPDYMNRFTDTERVHQLLSASKLSNDDLATIWAHVNKTFPGKLTNRELCLALALIAIFQRLERQESNSLRTSKQNPFDLVKTEKKPPVPTLYPNQRSSSNGVSPVKLAGLGSPTSFASNSLLVDLCCDDNNDESSANNLVYIIDSQSNNDSKTHNLMGNMPMSCNRGDKNLFNLIDMDGDRFELDFYKLTQVWLRFLSSIKSTFKRSFDILNVENSRQSAIEALKSGKGVQFSKHLSLCYPLAHNIKFKIDELDNIEFHCNSNTSMRESGLPHTKTSGLMDKSYLKQIDDLMISINEYWAVLINLFHESGQTKFIELIMDGLNFKTQTVFSKTIEELANELSSSGKSDTCSICHTKFYLIDCDPSSKGLNPSDVELLEESEEGQLLSQDDRYYYHAKCANFWLNQVDSSGLPFQKEQEEDILCPQASSS